MNTFFVIAVAAVQLALIAALRNRLRELKADLARYKLDEKLRRVIEQTTCNAAAIGRVRSSWTNAA